MSNSKTKTGDPEAKFTLPTFWEHDVTLWFLQIETFFTLNKVTNADSKALHTISSLPQNVLRKIADILPTTDYDQLKSTLLQRCEVSDQESIRKLLAKQELGDRKPSQLLLDLKYLAKRGNIPNNIVQEIWLQQLPTNIQDILQVSKEPLQKLGDIADKIMSRSQVQTETNVQSASLSQELTDLRKDINDLRHNMKFLLKPKLSPRHKTRSPSPQRPPRQRSPLGLCWYHRRYGRKAQRCQAPCNYQGN